ncbi:hypothetical protein NDU88_004563 [Pleurodeles waltl]|uniref:Uncharacterized protein n=1 Tax=Pleurodeles waltl TaxID=8319 RepID=A0AAV7M7G1_PLEWA|nr:hypothetical protein NDU88_004563 [Pleurodeles waltl]
MEANGDDHPGPTLNTILQTIAASRKVLELKIDTVVMDLSLLRHDQQRLDEQVTERDVEELTPEVSMVQTRLTSMESRIKTLEYRAKGTENRACHKNIRIIGLLEHIETLPPI